MLPQEDSKNIDTVKNRNLWKHTAVFFMDLENKMQPTLLPFGILT